MAKNVFAFNEKEKASWYNFLLFSIVIHTPIYICKIRGKSMCVVIFLGGRVKGVFYSLTNHFSPLELGFNDELVVVSSCTEQSDEVMLRLSLLS